MVGAVPMTDRVNIMAAMTTQNVVFGGVAVSGDTEARALPANQLSNILTHFGEYTMSNAAKPIKARRIQVISDHRGILDLGLPAPAPAAVLGAPNTGTNSNSLPDLSKRVSIQCFTRKEQREALRLAVEDGAKSLGVWGALQSRFEQTQPQQNLTQQEELKSEQLKMKIRECLANTLSTQLDKEITNNNCANTSWGIYQWTRERFIDMGEAEHTVNTSRLEGYSWKKSKLGFQA